MRSGSLPDVGGAAATILVTINETDGGILSYGRDRRLASTGQRRALAATRAGE